VPRCRAAGGIAATVGKGRTGMRAIFLLLAVICAIPLTSGAAYALRCDSLCRRDWSWPRCRLPPWVCEQKERGCVLRCTRLPLPH
jgi:hypothetical protein